jgi:hypothetical protein
MELRSFDTLTETKFEGNNVTNKTIYKVKVRQAEYTCTMRLRKPETQMHVCRNLDTAKRLAARLMGTDDNRPGGIVVYRVSIEKELVGPNAIV